MNPVRLCTWCHKANPEWNITERSKSWQVVTINLCNDCYEKRREIVGAAVTDVRKAAVIEKTRDE